METPRTFEPGLFVVTPVTSPASVASRVELLDRDEEVGRIEAVLVAVRVADDLAPAHELAIESG